MTKGSFYEGLEVEYKEYSGRVHFVGNDYITVCVSSGHSPVNDLCLVVYEEHWNRVKLVKESHK